MRVRILRRRLATQAASISVAGRLATRCRHSSLRAVNARSKSPTDIRFAGPLNRSRPRLDARKSLFATPSIAPTERRQPLKFGKPCRCLLRIQAVRHAIANAEVCFETACM